MVSVRVWPGRVWTASAASPTSLPMRPAASLLKPPMLPPSATATRLSDAVLPISQSGAVEAARVWKNDGENGWPVVRFSMVIITVLLLASWASAGTAEVAKERAAADKAAAMSRLERMVSTPWLVALAGERRSRLSCRRTWLRRLPPMGYAAVSSRVGEGAAVPSAVTASADVSKNCARLRRYSARAGPGPSPGGTQ